MIKDTIHWITNSKKSSVKKQLNCQLTEILPVLTETAQEAMEVAFFVVKEVPVILQIGRASYRERV